MLQRAMDGDAAVCTGCREYSVVHKCLRTAPIGTDWCGSFFTGTLRDIVPKGLTPLTRNVLVCMPREAFSAAHEVLWPLGRACEPHQPHQSD